MSCEHTYEFNAFINKDMIEVSLMCCKHRRCADDLGNRFRIECGKAQPKVHIYAHHALRERTKEQEKRRRRKKKFSDLRFKVGLKLTKIWVERAKAEDREAEKRRRQSEAERKRSEAECRRKERFRKRIDNLDKKLARIWRKRAIVSVSVSGPGEQELKKREQRKQQKEINRVHCQLTKGVWRW